MELDILGSGLSYGTADDLAVLPENDPEIVAALARWLGIEADLDRWFVLEPVDTSLATKPIFPTPCTLRKALTCYCDITGLPNKQFVSYMAHFAGLGEEVSACTRVCVLVSFCRVGVARALQHSRRCALAVDGGVWRARLCDCRSAGCSR
jgi:NADPH-ferrihemoprotein reductase